MSTPQRACAVLGALWVGMHAWHGIAFRTLHEVPPLNVLALLLYPVIMALAFTPLVTSRLELADAGAWTMAAAGIVIALLVLPFLTSEGLHSYAAWPAGGLGPLIAALVIRRHRGLAMGLAVTLCIIIALSAYGATEVSTAWVLSLCVPPAVWLGGALLTDHIFLRTDARVRQYARAELSAHARRTQARAQQSHALARRQSLKDEVLPLLQHLTSPHGLSTAERERCAQLATRLRDDLRARTLLSPMLHVLLSQARARGCQVTVVDDRHQPTHDETAERASELLRDTLPHLHGGRATYRVPPDDGPTTLVVEGDPHQLSVVVEAFTGRDDVSVDLDGSVLFVEASRRTTPRSR